MTYTFREYQKSPILRNHLRLGGANPAGERIDVTSLYLERGGKPWIGVMGEYHFSRAGRADWYRELCKMKAGGVTVVATYLFWIYHEEMEGEFDFTGDRDIGAFVDECARAGLDVVLRIGPWAHGECRNGGFPDWLLTKPFPLRDTNEGYMEKSRIWYEHIYEQVKGKFYKDGGNIIAVQLENEYVSGMEHLLALKKLAQSVGFDLPIYTVTGWNSVYGAKIPVDEVLPVFGAYPALPWEGHTRRLTPSENYVFDKQRNNAAIGMDIIKGTDTDGWRQPYERYPYAMCELGGGNEVTHHRRPIIRPMDIYAMSLVKLGSGNNLLGYYMYHGGTNKIGRLSTLQESRATGYPNDYAILSYDFQAPLSEFGEIREHYRLLNLLHLFVNDFNDLLAPMEFVEQEVRAARTDLSSLRYCMRTDGKSGFVFVNHHVRLEKMEDIKGAVVDTGSVVFPAMDICGESCFFMPFRLRLGGAVIEYATAQPLCRVGDTVFFTAIDGITPEYRFADGQVFRPQPGLSSAFTVGGIRYITLTFEQARFTRKIDGTLYIGEGCDIYTMDGAVTADKIGGYTYLTYNGEDFDRYTVTGEDTTARLTLTESDTLPFTPTHPEELCIGGERKLTYKKIEVSGRDGFVEIPDTCDVEQIYADGELAADRYYNGTVWRVPAKLLYGRDCWLVTSEMRDDFYRDF